MKKILLLIRKYISFTGKKDLSTYYVCITAFIYQKPHKKIKY